MIFDICAIFGHNVRPGDHSRMCFEPIASYTMSFRSFRTSFQPFSTFFDVFILFSMFPCLYLTYCYIEGLSMHSPYYSIPIRCASDLVWPFTVFIYLRTYQYSDVLVILMVDRFHWLWCYYMFRLQSLQTISHIQTPWRHFDPSDVSTTYTLPTTPMKQRITLHFVPPPL